MSSADGYGVLTKIMIGPGLMIAIVVMFVGITRLQEFRKTHPAWIFRPIDYLPALAGWCFVSMIFTLAVGSIYPPIVATVAEPIICRSGLEILSQNYSYSPGQQGTSLKLLCSSSGQSPRDVTILGLFVATLVYALLGFIGFKIKSSLHKRNAPAKP